MNTFILFGAFVTLFYILMLLVKQQKTLPDLFLGLIFLFYGLNIGLTWVELYNAKHGYPNPAFLNISWLFLLLHGPALWFYIKSQTVARFRFRWIYLLHLIPFLAFSTAQAIDFLSLPATERIRIVAEESFKAANLYKFSVIAIAISTITYNLWGLKLIKEHRFNLKKHFSRINDKDLGWLEILIIANLVIYGINVSLFNLDLVFSIGSYRLLMQLAYTFATIYTLFLGYFGLRQGSIFMSVQNIPGQVMYTESRKTAPEAELTQQEGFVNRLLTEMEASQPYLDPELTVARLADAMKVKPAYLSSVLNDSLQQSFFDFVNRYRVEAFKVKSIQEENARLSITGVAYDCGFNSKAAFYRAFRKYEGCSPTQYLEGFSKK